MELFRGEKWNSDAGSKLSRSAADGIARLQDELLRRHIRYCAANSPFYRAAFQRLAIDPREIQGVADLVRLPFTEKSELEKGHADFLAVPGEQIVDVCLTSGTTAKPVVMLQSAADLERLAYNEELSFRGAGFSAQDRVLVAAAVDRCFMAGLAYFLGLTRLGATVIRGGSSSVSLLVELIRNCRPTALVGVPSLLLAVGERLREEGAYPASLGISRMVCIGEPIRRQDLGLSPLGERLAELWKCALFGTYASTELATSFTDCPAGLGGHLHPELMVVEIIGEDGAPVPPGGCGEVVATPLGVTGMPLVRFRTGDLATLHTGPCPCGSTTPRLGPVLGRKSQMLKYRGTTVYPPAIGAVLQEMPGIRGHYIEVGGEFALSDRIKVVVGSCDAGVTAEAVAERIAAAVRVRPEVAVVTPEEIAAKTVREDKRKPVTFFDYRSG